MNDLSAGDPRHGTYNAYVNFRCRCGECKSANAKAQARMRAERSERLARGDVDVTHGLATTYGNWGCRCDACTLAWNACHAIRRRAIKSDHETALMKVQEYRQALWDIYAILGADTDGDATPDAVAGDLISLVVEMAHEFKADYDQALAEVELRP